MVTKVKESIGTPPLHFATLFRGFYGRVARQLGLDPSYVSRVARGERRSEAIEEALEREMKRVIKLAGNHRNGNTGNHSQAYHDGNGANHQNRDGAKKKAVVKKRGKTVIQ